MHVIDCECGLTLQAANEADLAKSVKEHVEESHPDMKMSDDELSGFVEEKSYFATDS